MTPAELVELVVPILPLPGCERLTLYGNPRYLSVDSGGGEGWEVRLDNLERFILGAIAEACGAMTMQRLDANTWLVGINHTGDHFTGTGPTRLHAAVAALLAARKDAKRE